MKSCHMRLCPNIAGNAPCSMVNDCDVEWRRGGTPSPTMTSFLRIW